MANNFSNLGNSESTRIGDEISDFAFFSKVISTNGIFQEIQDISLMRIMI